MYYPMTFPASSVKNFLRDISTLGKSHDPSAAGSLFVTVADSSTREYHQMLTRVSVSNIGR